MIKIEDDCVGCPYCINCGKSRTPHCYCDKCHQEVDELYSYYDEQLCEKCLLDEFPVVIVDEEVSCW
ncbi:MAG: hypothetical protein K2N49_01730 [Ruminococcus sp.]|nr:hypothetical protein [Ruminococcus sp.]MDE7225570.1 hypothetical protein [Ruminococcus sp.]